jgi:hypothetical protein
VFSRVGPTSPTALRRAELPSGSQLPPHPVHREQAGDEQGTPCPAATRLSTRPRFRNFTAHNTTASGRDLHDDASAPGKHIIATHATRLATGVTDPKSQGRFA